MKITKDWLKDRDACEPGVEWWKSKDCTDNPFVILELLKTEKPENWNAYYVWFLCEIFKTGEITSKQLIDNNIVTILH